MVLPTEAEAAFDHITVPGKKHKWSQCKYCNYSLSRNVTRLQVHLDKCPGYRHHRRVFNVTPLAVHRPVDQNLLDLTPTARKKAMDRAAALAIYCGGLPFNFYEPTAMQRLIAAIGDGYRGPSADELSGALLDEMYIATKKEVDGLIAVSGPLNLICRQISNHRGDQIFTMGVLLKGRQSLHLYAESAGSARLKDWMVQKLEHLTDGRTFKQINSVTINDCALDGLDPRLQHLVLFLPWDSHGLQLVMDDLISLPALKPFYQKALEIVQWFSKATNQIALLRKHQLAVYGEERPVITPAVLRCSTQLHLLEALDRNKAALRMFAAEAEANFTPEKDEPPSSIKKAILDSGFWADLDDVIFLIQPIRQLQKNSESDGATLDMVHPRWLKLEAHLTFQITYNRFGPALKTYLQHHHEFRSRRETYDTSAHRAAHFLLPANSAKKMDSPDRTAVLTFLKKYATAETITITSEHHGAAAAVEKEFDDFRARRNAFSLNRAAVAWSESKDPELFWILMENESPSLSRLGYQLAHTTTQANSSSVLFPGATTTTTLDYFGAIILGSGQEIDSLRRITQAARLHLPLERAQMLDYIHLNKRALMMDVDVDRYDDDGGGRRKRGGEDTTRGFMLEMEDRWFGG